MENEKVEYLINMINDMDIKDKLRLAICMSQSKWSGLIYTTKENYEKFVKLFNEKGEKNDENPAVVTTDGKYVYWAQNINGNTFDLYCYITCFIC